MKRIYCSYKQNSKSFEKKFNKKKSDTIIADIANKFPNMILDINIDGE